MCRVHVDTGFLHQEGYDFVAALVFDSDPHDGGIVNPLALLVKV